MRINPKRDYSEEITDICMKHQVKYLGLHGASLSQEDAAPDEPEINLLVEFLPSEPNQHTASFFALEKELTNLFGRHVNMVDLTDVSHPDLLRQLTKRKTDLYRA